MTAMSYDHHSRIIYSRKLRTTYRYSVDDLPWEYFWPQLGNGEPGFSSWKTSELHCREPLSVMQSYAQKYWTECRKAKCAHCWPSPPTPIKGNGPRSCCQLQSGSRLKRVKRLHIPMETNTPYLISLQGGWCSRPPPPHSQVFALYIAILILNMFIPIILISVINWVAIDLGIIVPQKSNQHLEFWNIVHLPPKQK